MGLVEQHCPAPAVVFHGGPEHGREAVNFQISMLIYAIISAFLFYLCIGFVLLPLVGILDIIFLIIAAIKANNGEHYRYPITIRFIS